METKIKIKENVVLPQVLCDNLTDSLHQFPWLRFEPRLSTTSIPSVVIEVNVFTDYSLCSSEISYIKKFLVSMNWSPYFDIDYDVVKRCFVLTFYAN